MFRARRRADTGADARQVGARWRHKTSARAGGLPDRGQWEGEARIRCESCGDHMRIAEEELGTVKSCRCGHLLRIPSNPGQFGAVRSERTRPWRHLGLAAAGLFGLLLATGYYLASRGGDNREIEGRPSETARLVLPPVREMRELAEAFLSAPTLEAKLPYLRFASGMQESVAAYYAERDSMVEAFQTVRPVGQAETRENSFGRFAVAYPDGTFRLIAIVATEAGAKVDWPTFCRYDHRLWNDFFSATDRFEGSFRVFASARNYYNYEFSDDGQYRSFRLDSPDVANPFYGYVTRGTETEKKMLAAIRGRGRQRVTLRLARDSRTPAGSGQVRISEVEVVGWTRPTGIEPPPVTGGEEESIPGVSGR